MVSGIHWGSTTVDKGIQLYLKLVKNIPFIKPTFYGRRLLIKKNKCIK